MPAPANDNFVDRETITGSSGSWSGTNVDATSEADEPAPYAGPGGPSIWFQWTAPATDRYEFNTLGSTDSFGELDTTLQVFTGSVLASLVEVAGNDDASPSVNSQLVVDATASTVYVIRVNGYASDSQGDIILNWLLAPPAPVITSITPGSADHGDEVVIAGANFTAVTEVDFAAHWQGFTPDYSPTPAVFTVDSDTQITAAVPPTAITGPLLLISVGGETFSDGFYIPGTFGIASFSPAAGPDGTEITVLGTGFTDVGLVGFGTHTGMLFTVDSDTQLRFTLNASGDTSGRIFLYNATVALPSFQDTYSHDTFYVGDPPAVDSFDPVSGPDGTFVTITGSDFTGVTAVAFGGVPATSFSFVDDATIRAYVPVGALTGPITVTTTIDGTSGDDFTVDGPIVTVISPGSGPVGDYVTVFGNDFAVLSAVAVGAVAVTTFTVVADTVLLIRIPDDAITAPITITGPNGDGTSDDDFTVTAANREPNQLFHEDAFQLSPRLTVNGRPSVGHWTSSKGGAEGGIYTVLSLVSSPPSHAAGTDELKVQWEGSYDETGGLGLFGSVGPGDPGNIPYRAAPGLPIRFSQWLRSDPANRAVAGDNPIVYGAYVQLLVMDADGAQVGFEQFSNDGTSIAISPDGWTLLDWTFEPSGPSAETFWLQVLFTLTFDSGDHWGDSNMDDNPIFYASDAFISGVRGGAGYMSAAVAGTRLWKDRG